MSTFKQKSLFAALAGLGVLGVVDSAQAVHINQDGLGQALVYPYFTARSTASGNAYVTALSVLNTTASAKAVKVPFLERKNSKEVLDFYLFLSQYDVWTAGIDAAGAGAGVFTADNSCTTPKVSNSATNPTKFRNGAYAGDGGGDGLDRTYEGYFEILEMGAIVGGLYASGMTPDAMQRHLGAVSWPTLLSDSPPRQDVAFRRKEEVSAFPPVVPVVFSYILSFVFVGIYWNNHQHLLHTVRRVSGPILWANLHLLFWLSLFPFATGWMGENHFAPAPTAVYGVVLLMAALAYLLLQRSIIAGDDGQSLLAQALGKDWKGKASVLFYMAAIAAAFWLAWAAQALYVIVALMWLIPDRRIEHSIQQQDTRKESP